MNTATIHNSYSKAHNLWNHSISYAFCKFSTMYYIYWIDQVLQAVECFKTLVYNISTCTSSSLRIGMLRTLYLRRSSFERGALIIFLQIWDGALKCRCLFLRLDELTSLLNFIFYKKKVLQTIRQFETNMKIADQGLRNTNSFNPRHVHRQLVLTFRTTPYLLYQ